MKRWPLVRHIRYYWLLYRYNRWWVQVGQWYWLSMNPSDEAYLADVWKGEM